MEEKNNHVDAPEENLEPSIDKQLEQKPKSRFNLRDKKHFKIIILLVIIFFVVLVSGMGAVYIKSVNQDKKVAVETKTALTPTPTASPSATPIPTNKVTYAPTASPTPEGPPTLVIRVNSKTNDVPDTYTLTIENQSTGKTITETGSASSKSYYLDPGAYRITINEKPEYRSAYAVCYDNCSATSGTWKDDDWGNVANINVEEGKTHGAGFYYRDSDNNGIKCTGGVDKPFCI